jgi:hypothetical protein
MKLLNNNYAYLPMVMNYTNAIFATLIIIPSYLLIKRLFGNPAVAFYAVLACIFSPVFFLGSIYGAPHVLAITFFVISTYCYLLWLDSASSPSGYLWLFLSSAAFLLTILFKASIILGGGIYFGLLYLRRIKDKQKIALSIISLALAFIAFLLIRQHIIPPSGESVTSQEGLTAYINYFFISPDIGVFIRQIKPAIFGAGLITSIAGMIAFLFFLLKKRLDVLIFILSWAAIPNLYWVLIWGNNARHHLIAILPLLAMIVIFFYEKAPRLTGLMTVALIVSNMLISSPSHSTYFPSGNIFKSQALLKEVTNTYHEKARKIVNLDQEKIAVMGYFHNPYVYYEIVSSAPSYEAELLTSVRSSVINLKAYQKEFMLCYVGSINPAANIESAINKYHLENFTFVSTIHDLTWLEGRGINTHDVGLVDNYHISSFQTIFPVFSGR